jgi:acetylornithine/succinyldiaminopimelate/putrescine aminotransferase
MGSLSATAQPKYHDGVEPMLAGFTYAPYGDLAAVESLVDDETAAIMIEPIQGEGGVRIPPPGFLEGLRKVADAKGLLLIFDEVQTGCGRTGEWFGYQYFNVTPDIMTLAKALCGGIAGGALLAKPEIATSLRPGMHAATFGGNPIASRAGIATLEMIERDGLLEHAKQVGEFFDQRFKQLAQECSLIKEVRVAGVMIGIELAVEGAPVVKECLDRRLLINCTHGTVIRLLPAMNLSLEQAEEGAEILAGVLRQLAG